MPFVIVRKNYPPSLMAALAALDKQQPEPDPAKMVRVEVEKIKADLHAEVPKPVTTPKKSPVKAKAPAKKAAKKVTKPAAKTAKTKGAK